MITLGRGLLALSAATAGIAPFIADWNHTHIYNPRWPPHAKFHNGQTMSMGVALSLATLYYTLRFSASPKDEAAKRISNSSTAAEKSARPSTQQVRDAAVKAEDSIMTATFTGTVYWITGISAFFYPGSKGRDPEFEPGPSQAPLFVMMLIATLAGGWLERRRLRKEVQNM